MYIYSTYFLLGFSHLYTLKINFDKYKASLDYLFASGLHERGGRKSLPEIIGQSLSDLCE